MIVPVPLILVYGAKSGHPVCIIGCKGHQTRDLFFVLWHLIIDASLFFLSFLLCYCCSFGGLLFIVVFLCVCVFWGWGMGGGCQSNLCIVPHNLGSLIIVYYYVCVWGGGGGGGGTEKFSDACDFADIVIRQCVTQYACLVFEN